MTDDKRKYKRIKSDFNVRVKQFDAGITISNAKSINVSATGVLFRHDKPLEIGSMVKLMFLKPNSFDFFEGNAKVVRIEMGSGEKAYDIGIEFLELSESDQKKLDYYLSSEIF